METLGVGDIVYCGCVNHSLVWSLHCVDFRAQVLPRLFY